MGIIRKLSARCDEKATSHPEVNQENQSTLEPNNYILATSIDGSDTFPLDFDGHLTRVERPRQPLVEDLDRIEPPAGEDRRQLGSNGFDLG